VRAHWFKYTGRPGGFGHSDLWQVSIGPVVDLNGDGIVDCLNMCIMVDHRHTDGPSCDIGQTPLRPRLAVLGVNVN